MSGLLAGLAVGGVLGAGLCASVGWLRSWLSIPAPELSSDDRDAFAEEFAHHSAAVRQQVSAFADTLAGGDLVLRERLRRFEAGDGS